MARKKRAKPRSQPTPQSDASETARQSRTRKAPNVAREKSPCALLLIDVVNGLDFEGAEPLATRAPGMAHHLAALKSRARGVGIPAIYVNDNFGRWRSDFKAIYRHCARRSSPGREIARLLAPQNEDYFVLKPYNSGFFSTVLESLLESIGARTLILGGIATDNCVLFTAHDAYLRGYRLLVPRDCCVADTAAHHRQALALIERVMKADTRPSRSVRLAAECEQSG